MMSSMPSPVISTISSRPVGSYPILSSSTFSRSSSVLSFPARAGVSTREISSRFRNCPIAPAISSTRSARPAPSRNRPWQPCFIGFLMEPGTANTSRFCSRACLAVLREPLLRAASTTRTASLRPLMTRLRRGKLCGNGRQDKGNSDTRAPLSLILSASTATVLPCCPSAPRCASVSIPRASPLVTVIPCLASSPAK